MGYHSDLGSSETKDICPLTGYPRDEYGHLLDPFDHKDGKPVPDWNKKGTKLWNLTSPYGHLEFAVGSGDDFHCFDYATINAGPLGEFVILHSVVNSETGSFIDGAEYIILPANSIDEKLAVINAAEGMVSNAQDWCGWNDLRHTTRGWNQDPCYFVNAVARNLFDYAFKKYNRKTNDLVPTVSEREIRRNSKRVQKIVQGLFAKEAA